MLSFFVSKVRSFPTLELPLLRLTLLRGLLDLRLRNWRCLLILWITLRVRIGTEPAGGADMVIMFMTCSS